MLFCFFILFYLFMDYLWQASNSTSLWRHTKKKIKNKNLYSLCQGVEILVQELEE